MEEGLNKPLISQRCLQTSFFFLHVLRARCRASRLLSLSLSRTIRLTKRKIEELLYTGYRFAAGLLNQRRIEHIIASIFS